MKKEWFKAHVNNARHESPINLTRNIFQRDRNLIIYSTSFRRLGGKTQIFISNYNDNLRNRLTHSIEVKNIASIIGSDLKLDLNLIDAIALGHDIGHTPFGHMGENTLNFIMNGCIEVNAANYGFTNNYKGFKHNYQGLRILSYLGVESKDFIGLNLTDYCLWGVLHHTSVGKRRCEYFDTINFQCNRGFKSRPCSSNGYLHFDFYSKRNNQALTSSSWTLEGLVVQIADEITQRFHDIEDAVKAQILSIDKVMEQFRNDFYHGMRPRHKTKFNKLREIDGIYLMPSFRRFLLNFYVDELCINSSANLRNLAQQFNIRSSNDFNLHKGNIQAGGNLTSIVNYSPNFITREKAFHDFLKSQILKSYLTQNMDNKGDLIIRKLFEAYISYPEHLPDYTIFSFFRNLDLEKGFQIQFNYKEFKPTVLRKQIRDLLNSNKSLVVRAVLFRTIADHIASMTDNYAHKQYEMLYGLSGVQ
jgi:dGTPase